MGFKLDLSAQDLDLIAKRVTSGQMEYATAMAVSVLLSKIESQANDKDLQSLVPPTIVEPVEAKDA